MREANILFVIALVSIVVSVGGLVSTYGSLVALVQADFLTGYATSEGSVNVTIIKSVSANFTSNNVSWGSGMVDFGETNATIDTEGIVSRGNWSSLSEGLVVKNEGNVVVVLEINSSNNATQFLGGTAPAYQYKVSDVDEGACIPPTGFSLGTYYDINSTATQICSSLSVNESVNVDFKLVIPSNSDSGILSSTITIGYEEAM